MINFYEQMPKSYIEDSTAWNPNQKKGVLMHPFRALIVGAAGSMKTNTCLNIISDCNNYEKIFLYTQNLEQPLYKYLQDQMRKVEQKIGAQILTVSNDISELADPKEFDMNVQNLVIIDDMILEKDLKSVIKLYVFGRHFNISVIFISQTFHHIPKIIRLNANYLILKNINSIKDFKLIVTNYSLDILPNKLYDIYKKATIVPSSFFMIDLCTVDPKLRYRSNYKPLII